MLWRTTHPALHAIVMTSFGFFFYSLGDATSKWLTHSYAAPQIVVLASLFAFVCGSLWLLKTKGWRGFSSKSWRWHIARGLSISMTGLLVVKTLSHVPLADFYSIVFLTPMLVSLLSAVIFKEKIGLHRMVSLIAGFIGVIIVAGPQFDHMNIGLLLSFLCAVMITSNLILVRKITDGGALPLYFIYPLGFNVLLYTPLMLMDYTPVAPAHWALFMANSFFIAMGAVATALGFSRAPESAIVAPFHYTQMIWGVIIGFILFGDVPSLTTFGGASLIIGSGLWIIWHEHRLHLKRKESAAQELPLH